jgi:pilus assembly protein CpaD
MTRLRPTAFGLIGAGILALAVSGCAPAPADWTPAQADTDGAVARTHERLVLRTPEGRLDAGAMSRLDELLARKGIDTLWVTLRPRSQAGRAAVAPTVDTLVDRGVAADRIATGTGDTGGAGDLAVVVERWVALAPDCPDWSRANLLGDNNLRSSNFGCATRANRMRQVADPRDLVRGRQLAPVPPETAAGAVERYRARDVEPLRETSVSGVE